jgi:hypothetical protein
LREKDEFFRRSSVKNSFKSIDALQNAKFKLNQSFKDETYKGAKTLHSYKNYLKLAPSTKDIIIVEVDDSGIDPLFIKIEESFKKIRKDIESLLTRSEIDEVRTDLLDRLKQIDDKTRELRNLWLQAKI